jgi:hypothetical protein
MKQRQALISLPLLLGRGYLSLKVIKVIKERLQ